jgi:hypothetical protein
MSALAAENVDEHRTTADGQVRAVDRVSFAFDEGTLNILLGARAAGVLVGRSGCRRADHHRGDTAHGGASADRVPPDPAAICSKLHACRHSLIFA